MVDTSYYPRAKGAIEDARKQLHARSNVHGVGLGPKQVNDEDTETLAIQVFVERKVPTEYLDGENIIPETITIEDGSEIPTDVQQLDRFAARSAGEETDTGVISPRRTIQRPVPGGVSGGHPGVSGTIGGVFVDGQGRHVGLTNEHVAASGLGTSPGDVFTQPSNSYTDTDQAIGTSVEFSGVDPADSATNTSDSALIELDSGVSPTDSILGVGELGAPENPLLDVTYLNSGMTSRLKSSEVYTTDFSATVAYADGDAYFEGLVVFGGITLPGDSGSIFARYDPDTGLAHPAALNFAASGGVALAIPWSAVEAAHSTLSTLPDADTAAISPVQTTRTTDAAPISMETNGRGQLEVLATPYGDPDDMSPRTVRLRDGAADGPIIDTATPDPEWGQPQILTFEFFEYFGEGTNDVAIDAGNSATEIYNITATGIRDEYPFRPTIEDAAGDPISGAAITVREQDSTTQVATATTDDDGSVEIWLPWGEYTVTVEDDRYRTQVIDINIEGTREPTYTLTEYGDSIDTSTLPQVETLTTSGAGEGEFPSLTHAGYVAEIDKPEYRTYTTQVSHDGPQTLTVDLEPTDLSNPPTEPGPGDGDEEPEPGPGELIENPHIDLPQGDSFFELTPLTARADDSSRLPVLVTNAGGGGDAAEIRLEDPIGRVTDRQTVSLGAGRWQIINLSARRLLERTATTPASARLSSGDQTENIDIFPGSEPADVIGPGRPATMGGRRPATMGGRRPATLGRQRERETEPVEDISRVEDDWALTLINPADERRHEPVMSAPDPQLVHTELMDWTLDVPADPALEDWTFNTRAVATFDEEVVFRGWCHEASSTTDGQTTTLTGTGPAGEITHGSVEQSFHHIFAWRAIEQFTDEFLSDWNWFVVPPTGDNSVLIVEDDVSGSPMECLTRLHDDYGMRFRVDNTQFRTAISFPAGAETTNTTSSFDVLSHERTQTSEGYANGVEVVGATRPAGGVVNESRYRAQYVDTDEVERLATQLGVRESDAREIVQIRDSSIESDAQAQSRARAKTREFSQRNELGGTIETPARMYEPGIAYTLPWDDGQAVGSFAMQFTPTRGSYVDLPHRLFSDRQRGGAITAWVRAPWSQLSGREVRLFGASDRNGRGLRTHGADSLSFVMDGTNSGQARVDAHPDPLTAPPDDRWLLVHYDWSFSPDATETTLRAGINGQITDQATLGGLPAMPGLSEDSDAIGAQLGRWQDDYYLGRLDHIQVFDAPQSPAHYREIGRGNAVPATDLIAKYPLDEGPPVEQNGATVFDVVGGHDGTAHNVVSSGSPQTLESVGITGGTATLEFRRTITQNDAISHALREIRRMQ